MIIDRLAARSPSRFSFPSGQKPGSRAWSTSSPIRRLCLTMRSAPRSNLLKSLPNIAEEVAAAREHMIALIAETDEALGEKYLMGRRNFDRRIARRAPARDHWQQTGAGPVRHRAQEQGHPIGARCGRRLSSFAPGYSASSLAKRLTGNPQVREASENGSAFRAGVQNCDRPVCRASGLHSRLFRQIDERLDCPECDQESARAHRAFAPHARQQPRRD